LLFHQACTAYDPIFDHGLCTKLVKNDAQPKRYETKNGREVTKTTETEVIIKENGKVIHHTRQGNRTAKPSKRAGSRTGTAGKKRSRSAAKRK